MVIMRVNNNTGIQPVQSFRGRDGISYVADCKEIMGRDGAEFLELDEQESQSID